MNWLDVYILSPLFRTLFLFRSGFTFLFAELHLFPLQSPMVSKFSKSLSDCFVLFCFHFAVTLEREVRYETQLTGIFPQLSEVV